MVPLVIGVAYSALSIGAFLAWSYFSTDGSATPGYGTVALAAFPTITGMGYVATGSVWALIAFLLTTAIWAWVAWQWLVAAWGPATVYLLRMDASTGNRRGFVCYVGSTDRSWHVRKGEHQDDRDGGWLPWKAEVDWSISGPAWRRLTASGARRQERRMIRTLTYAGQIGALPRIRNVSETKLRSPLHPVLWARLAFLRVQGLAFPSRKLHLSPRPLVEALPPADIDVRTTPLDQMDPVDAAEVASATATNGPVPVPPDGPASGSGSASTEGSGSGSTVATIDPTPAPEDVSPDLLMGAHEQPAHVAPTLPPVGGESDEQNCSRATVSGEQTSDDPGEGDGLDDRPGIGDEVEAWLASEVERSSGSGEGPPESGGRGSSGGKAPTVPPWVPRARELRRAGLSAEKIRLALIAEGVDPAPSRPTVQRWVADASE